MAEKVVAEEIARAKRIAKKAVKRTTVNKTVADDLKKRVNKISRATRGLSGFRGNLEGLSVSVKKQANTLTRTEAKLRELTERVEKLPVGKLQIQFENLGQELTLNHQETRAVNEQVKKNAAKLRGMHPDAWEQRIAGLEARLLQVADNTSRLVDLEDAQKKQVGRLELIRVLAERLDRVERSPAGLPAEALVDLEKSVELHTRQIKLLEQRFREHLDELRSVPDPRIAHLEGRLEKHAEYQRNLEDRILALQVQQGSVTKQVPVQKVEKHAVNPLFEQIETRTTDDEMAKHLIELYFTEVARYSFKRSLSLEDLLNAYNFVRKRITEHRIIRAQDIEQAIKSQQ